VSTVGPLEKHRSEDCKIIRNFLIREIAQFSHIIMEFAT